MILLSTLNPILAQAGKIMLVHEDQVSPAKVEAYEQAMQRLLKALDNQGDQALAFQMFQTDEFRFLQMSPLDSMAMPIPDRLGILKEQMEEEAYKDLMDALLESYDQHESYLLHLSDSLSFMPEMPAATMSKMLFRRMDYYYIHPSHWEEALQLAAEMKALHKEAGSVMYYRVYLPGFGFSGPVMMLAYPAQSAGELERRMVTSMTSMDERMKEVLRRMNELTRQFVSVTAYVRPELSTIPVEKWLEY